MKTERKHTATHYWVIARSKKYLDYGNFPNKQEAIDWIEESKSTGFTDFKVWEQKTILESTEIPVKDLN